MICIIDFSAVYFESGGYMSAALQQHDYAYDQDKANPEETEHSLEFHRFSESPIWQQQRDFFENEAVDGWSRNPEASAAPNNPLMAHTYVEMILAFWQDNLDMGLINAEQPLYILELGAGNGELAHGIAQQLFERLEDSHLKLLKPVYIVSDLIQANLDFASSHPKLAPFVSNGQIDLALLNAEDVNQIRLYKSGVTLTRDSLHNPLAVIANNVFGCLKQDLIAIHYGKFFDGYIAAASSENRELDLTQYLQYDWCELPDTHHYDSTLLDHYRRYLNSNPILVPTGAINCLDSLGQLTQLPLLVLSADRGISTLQQLRQQAAPAFANDASLALPVNYHALGLLTETQGGIAMNCQRQSNCLAISALIVNTKFYVNLESPITNTTKNALNRSNTKSKNYKHTSKAFLIHIDQFNPGDATFLSHTNKTCSYEYTPEIIANHLRLSHWDYQIIDMCFDSLSQQIAQLQPDERNQWKAALQCTWKNYYQLDKNIEACLKIGVLATGLGLWGLGKGCFLTLFNYQKHLKISDDASFTHYFNWALCCFQLGEFTEAAIHITQAMTFTQPGSSNTEQCKYLLEEIYCYQQLPEWYESEFFSQGELSLQPMRQMHSADVLYQMRDPSIAAMTGLPDFENIHMVKEWIEECGSFPKPNIAANKTQKITLAIIHRELGFVGSVALNIVNSNAFFYFWIGADYQGKGFGPKAMKILIEAAKNKFFTLRFFAAAFFDNYRSINSFLKYGWKVIPYAKNTKKNRIIDKNIKYLYLGGNISSRNLNSVKKDLRMLFI